jgi:hypothetical protein
MRNGKGSTPRRVDMQRYHDNYDRIFGRQGEAQMGYTGRALFDDMEITIREHGPDYIDIETAAGVSRWDRDLVQKLRFVLDMWCRAGEDIDSDEQFDDALAALLREGP